MNWCDNDPEYVTISVFHNMVRVSSPKQWVFVNMFQRH